MLSKEGDPINYPDQYNHEGYLDMTAYLATKDLERPRKLTGSGQVYKRGNIYLADLDPSVGSEQGGVRPVLVLQNDTGNLHGPTVIIAPITSRTDKRRDLPIHYYAHKVRGLNGPAMVLLEQIRTIDKTRVRKYLGRMTVRQMDEISKVLETSLGLETPVCKDAP